MTRTASIAFTLVALCACSRADSNAGADSTAGSPAGSAAPSASTANESVPSTVSLSPADLDGFEKGLAEEIRLVKEGKIRADRATTATERGIAIQSTFEENTSKSAIPVSGLSFERYHLVRETMSRLLTTLDFQGKIDGPQSVDTARADSAMKARLQSDPYAVLDAASAEAVKARLSKIAPLWIEYVNLTVVGG